MNNFDCNDLIKIAKEREVITGKLANLKIEDIENTFSYMKYHNELVRLVNQLKEINNRENVIADEMVDYIASLINKLVLMNIEGKEWTRYTLIH